MVYAFGRNVLRGVVILKLALIILGSVLLVFLLALCSSPDETSNRSLPRSTATPRPTATPAPLVSAYDLYYEREENAERFDAQYKGMWVRVFGEIVEIDGGRVVLDADSFLGGVALYDLPDNVRIELSRWDDFVATCKVGNYIFGTIRMKDCYVE